MILIISNETEFTTNNVIDWLKYYNEPFKRISYKQEIVITAFKFLNGKIDFRFTIDDEEFDFNTIKSIWYRRSGLKINTITYKSNIDILFDQTVNNQLSDEIDTIHKLIWDLFKSKSINTQYDNRINKLVALKACSELGISYPRTLITASKEELKKFKKECGRIITKNMNQGLLVNLKDTTFMPFTTEIKKDAINELPTIFAPMFFQEMVEKSFELRIYYLKGTFYSSAIFSQSDEQTKVDFRNYNFEKPNRTPPFKLSKIWEDKLTKLMNHLHLNSGSIDILVDQKGTYYFLEVNPIGQFTQVSYPCNYHLEKIVAKQLIQ